jgi:phosphoribosyl 1,2-cyclic phosphodiesterase
MTHFHSDHIQGIPFFSPLFHAGNELFVYSDRESDDVKNILAGQMASPYFPVPFSLAAARREYIQLKGQALNVAGAWVTNFPLNHPQGATGYRIEAGGAVIVHASDHEHGREGIDHELRRQCEGADLLIYDAQYTPEEYATKRGWGHSTYAEAARVANDSGVKHLVLFHHDPLHNDEFMNRIVEKARELFPHTEGARENWEIQL